MGFNINAAGEGAFTRLLATTIRNVAWRSRRATVEVSALSTGPRVEVIVSIDPARNDRSPGRFPGRITAESALASHPCALAPRMNQRRGECAGDLRSRERRYPGGCCASNGSWGTASFPDPDLPGTTSPAMRSSRFCVCAPRSRCRPRRGSPREAAASCSSSHDESVGPRAEQGDPVAGVDFGNLAVLREEVAAHADRTDDVDDLGFPGAGSLSGGDLVVAFVEGGADEVVHRRVNDLEGLRGAALFIEHLGEEDARVPDQETAGLEDDAQSERLQVAARGIRRIPRS